jgi:ornithine cyclodeaminase/alanine dehydrogenase-like protein (mu-crystallin family)
METLMLTRSEVEQALSPTALLDALRSGFAAYSTQRSIDAMRVTVPLPQQRAGASGMLLAPGLVPGIPAYSVKVHARFPGGDPAIQGVLILHDLETGAPLAILESSYLTALRTGFAGALGGGCAGAARRALRCDHRSRRSSTLPVGRLAHGAGDNIGAGLRFFL